MIDEKVMGQVRMLTECYPFDPKDGMVVHPLTCFTIQWDGVNKPIVLDTTNFKEWMNQRLDLIAKMDSLEQAFLLEGIRTPFQLDYLYFVQDLLPADEFARCLGMAWQACEFPHQTPVPKLVSMWKRLQPKYASEVMTSEDEYRTWLELQAEKEIVVYRGLRKAKHKVVRGLSWTLYQSKAEWFAKRFSSQGKEQEVYSATISGSSIFAYFDRENEVIVNPDHLRNVQHYSLGA